MNGKCLFFDIDGTLVDEKTHHIPQDAVEALHKARKAGHYLFINTGRPYSHIIDEVKNVGFDGYCCGCGSEVIMENEEIYCHRTSVEQCSEIRDKAAECGIDLFGENTPTCYLSDGNTEQGFDAILEHLYQEGFSNIEKWENGKSSFIKFCMVYDDHSRLEEFVSFLKKSGFEFIDRAKYFGEVIPQHCSKATAIDLICEKCGVTLDDCYVFGDSANDLSMLKHVRHSILMGNGEEKLKSVVETVTDHIDCGGIEKALKSYNLI